MKLSLVVLALVSPLLALAGGPTPVKRDTIFLNPHGIELNKLATRNDGLALPAPASAASLTNAQRLTRGLPLNPPHRPKSGRSAISPLPSKSYTGRIKVIDVDTSTMLGYVYSVPNIFGEYGIDSDASNALLVTFSDRRDGTPFDIITTNGFADYSFFGGIEGFASTSPDFSSGSFNYAYLGGVTQTPAGSPPVSAPNSFTAATAIQKTVESAIFFIDESTNTLTAQWVNTNGAHPATHIVYYPADNVIILTGDVDSFRNAFGSSPLVKLVFEVDGVAP